MPDSAEPILAGTTPGATLPCQDVPRQPATGWAIAVRFVPAALVLGAWLGWLAGSGGYFSRDWYPVALGAVALLAVQAVAGRRILPASRAARAGLLLFGGFVAWNFASIPFAISADGAWQASNQWLLYLALTWILALVPWTAKSAAVLGGAWSLGVAMTCAVVLVGALGAHDLSHYMIDGRWQQPIGYANASSAIAALAFLPALVLSAHGRVPPVLRIVYLVVAAFLVDYALLPQSRGALIGLVLATALLIVLAPGRGRLLAGLGVLGAVIALGVRSIYAVYDAAYLGRSVAPVLQQAASRILLGAGVALVGGIAIVLAERVRPSARAIRRARLILSPSLAAVLLFAGVVLAIAESNHIGHYISSSWHVFSSPVERPGAPGPRIAFVNSDQRYDLWREALRAFRSSPMHGIGSGSFQQYYIAHRHVDTYVRQPHDVWLRVLSETGVVGAVLFLGVLLVMLAALLRARSRLNAQQGALVAVGLAVLAYFLIHSTVDWLDVIPAVAAPAIALPFVALVVSRRQPVSLPAGARAAGSSVPLPVRRLELGAGAVVVLAALVSLAVPYLSSRQLDLALARADRDVPGALAAAREAARLDPVATLPHDAAGTIALQSRLLLTARLEFRRSLDLQDAWYPHLELALLESRAGRFAAARDQIARARSLDPLDLFLGRAADLIAHHHRIDAARFNAGVFDSPLTLRAKML